MLLQICAVDQAFRSRFKLSQKIFGLELEYGSRIFCLVGCCWGWMMQIWSFEKLAHIWHVSVGKGKAFEIRVAVPFIFFGPSNEH